MSKDEAVVPAHPTALVLMGVSGSGKTSVGRKLSEILGWPFYDGDEFHPPENVHKMASGIPLEDADRAPWLAKLHALIASHLAGGQSMLLACSALKQAYRRQLAYGIPGTLFVYLRGDFDLIYARLQARGQHYMQADMLRSQFETLEPPTGAISVNIDQSVAGIARDIIRELDLDVII